MSTLLAAGCAAGCLGGVLAACGGGAEGDAERPVDPPRGVSVELHQFRVDQVARRLLVGVRIDGPARLYVRDLQLVSDSFATIPPTRIEQSLAPTPRVDLSIPFGASRCHRRAIPAVRPAAVIARIKNPDGRVRKVRFRLRHPEPLLAQTLTGECGTYLLRQSIGARFGPSWTEVRSKGRAALRGDLLINRTGRGRPATIVTLGSNPHFNITLADEDLPYTIPAGAGELALPVEVTPARCDAHAFAEAKYAQHFSLFAEIGDGHRHKLPFESAGAVRTTFDAFAHRACGIPSGRG